MRKCPLTALVITSTTRKFTIIMLDLYQNTTNELLKRLITLLEHTGHRDIDAARLKKEFSQLLRIDPETAHFGLALIACHLQRDEKATYKHAEAVINYTDNDPRHMVNYAVMLKIFNNFTKARQVLARALKHIHKYPFAMNNIAREAYVLGAEELFHDIMDTATELGISSAETQIIACEIALANAENTSDTIHILEQERRMEAPILINDEKWQEFKSLADKLRS